MAKKKKSDNVMYEVKEDKDGNRTIEEYKPQPHKDTKASRSRCFFIRTYINPNALQRFLKNSPWVQHWIFLVHNRCIDTETGELKEPHAHLILYIYEAKTIPAVQKIFDRYALSITNENEQKEGTFVQITHDKVFAFRYLMHLDNPDKVKYGYEELVYDSWDYWSRFQYTEGMTDCVQNVALQIIDDMRSGVDHYTLIERYGMNFVKNISNFHKALQMVNYEYKTLDIEKDFRSILLESAWFNDEQICMFENMLAYVEHHFISSNKGKITYYLTACSKSAVDVFVPTQSNCITDTKKNQ